MEQSSSKCSCASPGANKGGGQDNRAMHTRQTLSVMVRVTVRHTYVRVEFRLLQAASLFRAFPQPRGSFAEGWIESGALGCRSFLSVT